MGFHFCRLTKSGRNLQVLVVSTHISHGSGNRVTLACLRNFGVRVGRYENDLKPS